MKHKAFTLVEAIVLIVILAVIAAVLFPVFFRARENVHRRSCPSNLKQIGLGFLQYIQDYDEKFPPVSNAVGGWVTLLQPYMKSEMLFQCPGDPNSAKKTNDYFYNARLSGARLKNVKFSTLTILAGDGVSNAPFNSSLSNLPVSWNSDKSSPAWRHENAAFYAFVDGHVKRFRADEITPVSPASGQITFRVK